MTVCRIALVFLLVLCAGPQGAGQSLRFDVRSTRSGHWSDPATWTPARVPRGGDRVLVLLGTEVLYDVASPEVIRLLHVAGALRFSRDRDTLLEAGVIKVQAGDECSESGFACGLLAAKPAGGALAPRRGEVPVLEVGTPEVPIPAEHVARIRLHWLEGMDRDDAPALVCCGARLDLHGAPMSRTWVDLGEDARVGDRAVVLAEPAAGWRLGDEVIVTGAKRKERGRTFRGHPKDVTTELRRIARIDGARLELDLPLGEVHSGTGKFRSEVANLSRSVVVESADPAGARGHTVYHRSSQGSISYARLAHLGKEGILGRYAIHFHLAGDTMRGASVVGAAIVDSHNRWITIHGTDYLVVRDCVGYGSVGHGFFLEDGTEVYNLLDHNLAVHAYRGRPLPRQVLPFDPNDGAGFWWANGRNALVRNTTCENDEYGFRYDSQKRSNFDSELLVRMPDGKEATVDIRTLPVWRFTANEAHTEGLYGFALAGTDGVGPDHRHPHVLQGLTAWEVHYGLRPELPAMWIEDVDIDHAAYGIYRPWFENHVYRNLRIADTAAEPFNRGLDDESAQHGRITVDGLLFAGKGYGQSMPLIQISDNDLSGRAESHFRGVRVEDRSREPRPLVNLGGGPRPEPKTERGVPVYLHDWYGPGRHAEVVSTRARDVQRQLSAYREDPPLTGDESRVREVTGVEFPRLLEPIDDQPPATVVLSVRAGGDGSGRRDGEAARVRVRGVSFDNGEIARVEVNGQPARIAAQAVGVADWEAEVALPSSGKVCARAVDAAGNVETAAHEVVVAPAAAATEERRF